MPLPAELRKGLDSEVADLVNTGPREGGMLTAGLFLQEFVAEGVRWAHLDIAGPAYNSADAYGYTPHGGTGRGRPHLRAAARGAQHDGRVTSAPNGCAACRRPAG
jgi:leucyl aminopeptidase